MSKEIESKVAELLTQYGVVFSAVYRGEKKGVFGDAKNIMDQWDCTFEHKGTYEKPAPKTAETQQFDFFTGLGLRVDTVMSRMARANLKGCSQNSIAWIEGVTKLMKPQAPSAASVLHSLILDSSAASQSFADWCSDFGYDTDSRKALTTYEACQNNADKLRRIFSGDQCETLSETLQDY